MDSKAPPQYASPAPVAATPVPQYSSPPPQQQHQYPPQPQPQQQPQQYSLLLPPLQPGQYGQPVQPQPVQTAAPQHHHQQPPAAPAQYRAAAPMVPRGNARPNSTQWTHSLMDCSPCDTCCLATFLPCIVVGQTADRLRDPTMATADSMNSECLVFTAIQCITGCGWIYIMAKRTEIRERFGIQGDGTTDCCATYCCPCCALIQQDNEVKARTTGAVPVNAGYQAQPGMVMPQK